MIWFRGTGPVGAVPDVLRDSYYGIWATLLVAQKDFIELVSNELYRRKT